MSYYCEQIERNFPDVTIHKSPAECKNNVITIWSFINWNQYSRNSVLFFVDRDLSYWVGEPQYYDTNVYITDEYSLENDAVNLHMFLKLLEDFYGFANYTEDEKARIGELYTKKWNKFKEGSYELMSYILYKYQTSHEHTAKNISMRKCLCVDSDCMWNKTIRGLPYKDYYREQLQIGDNDISDDVSGLKDRFINEGEHYSVRGKWCLEFMIELMDYVIKIGDTIAPSLYNGVTKRPKKIVDLTSRGAIATIGSKIVPPKSLTSFLSRNIGNVYK